MALEHATAAPDASMASLAYPPPPRGRPGPRSPM